MKVHPAATITAIALGMAMLVTGCSSSSTPSTSSTSPHAAKTSGNPYNLITPGDLLVSTSGDQPPFTLTGASGAPEGFLIDIVHAVSQKLGLKVTYKVSDPNSAIQGLTTKQYDLVADGLGVTPQRAESIDFLKGLYWSTTAVMTKKSAKGKSMNAFSGKHVGVVTGSVQVAYLANMPGAVEVDYDSETAAVSALNSGTIDAFLVGGPDADAFLKQFSGLKVAASAPVDHPTTMAVQKGNLPLEKAFNSQVKTMIANGSFQKIYKKYFVEAPQQQLVSIWPGLK
jgi:ABC-type amino acid transport substrate-binding protein